MTVSVKEMITFGWETFKKRPWMLVAGFALVFIISGVLSGLLEAILPSEGGGATFFTTSLNACISIAVGTLTEMGLLTFFLRAHDAVEQVSLNDLWNPEMFLYYLFGQFLVGGAVLIGLALLIVPGIIFALMFIFTPYLILDKKLSTIEAMKESARMTKGHRMQLFVLIVAILGLNLLGLIALFVGLFISVPVTILALAHTYRHLSHVSATA